MRASGTTHENLVFSQVTGTGYDAFKRHDFNSLNHATHQAIDGNICRSAHLATTRTAGTSVKPINSTQP